MPSTEFETNRQFRNLMLSQESKIADGQAKSAKCKARDCRAMRRTFTYVAAARAMAATPQLVSFCDAIKLAHLQRHSRSGCGRCFSLFK
jgi:hypothetical protein